MLDCRPGTVVCDECRVKSRLCRAGIVAMHFSFVGCKGGSSFYQCLYDPAALVRQENCLIVCAHDPKYQDMSAVTQLSWGVWVGKLVSTVCATSLYCRAEHSLVYRAHDYTNNYQANRTHSIFLHVEDVY